MHHPKIPPKRVRKSSSPQVIPQFNLPNHPFLRNSNEWQIGSSLNCRLKQFLNWSISMSQFPKFMTSPGEDWASARGHSNSWGTSFQRGSKVIQLIFINRNGILVGGLEHGFYFPFHIWDNHSHWLSYFSRWLKPLTSFRINTLQSISQTVMDRRVVFGKQNSKTLKGESTHPRY